MNKFLILSLCLISCGLACSRDSKSDPTKNISLPDEMRGNWYGNVQLSLRRYQALESMDSLPKSIENDVKSFYMFLGPGDRFEAEINGRSTYGNYEVVSLEKKSLYLKPLDPKMPYDGRKVPVKVAVVLMKYPDGSSQEIEMHTRKLEEEVVLEIMFYDAQVPMMIMTKRKQN